MRLTTYPLRATAPRRATPALAAIAPLAALLLAASPVHAAPSKWLLSSTVGHDVNKTKTEAGAPQEERNQCVVGSGDECQYGEEGNGEPRAMPFANSVAVDPASGDVYVAAAVNGRIEKLGPTGEFLLMWGWDVNKTKVALGAGATQQEKNVCTAASGDECGRGESGSGLAEQLGNATVNVAVAPSTGDVYLVETAYNRVEEFTENGEFVLMFGGGVNSDGANVCAKAEQSRCQSGAQGSGHGEFSKLYLAGDDIAFGPEGLLYVGDEERVQKFEADGEWVGQFAVSGPPQENSVDNVAVDPAGDVFVSVAGVGSGVHEYDAAGALQTCVLAAPTSSEPSAGSFADGIAIDPDGRVGVDYYEHVEKISRMVVYKTGGECGQRVGGEVTQTEGNPFSGIAFSFNATDEDTLYVLSTFQLEIFKPVLFPEARTCAPSEVLATSATLCGEVNPNSIETSAFFEYGPAGGALEAQTPFAFTGSGEAFTSFSYALTGLTPNQLYSYETWVQAESEGTLATAGGPPPASFHTSTPPPEVSGTPEASFLTASSAVLSATLDPEHAQTSYRFQYAACSAEGQSFAQCGPAQSSQAQESAQYGAVTAIQAVSGLQPQTTYVYRLLADNGFEYEGKPEGGASQGVEGHFTTAASSMPTAETGPVNEVGATSAVISGLVNPDGAAATYAFELGIDEGPATQYGVVASGPAGAGVGAVQETVSLAGLQPGTAYSYRIRIDSGYGHVLGAVASFTTQGVPQLLQAPGALPLLAAPAIVFPKPAGKSPAGECKKGHARNRHGKCVKRKSKQRKGHRAHKSSHRPAGGRRH